MRLRLIILLLFVLTGISQSQNEFEFFGKEKKNQLGDVFALSFSGTRTTDTTQKPPTPFISGWGYWKGNGQHLFTGQANDSLSFPWASTNSFYIEMSIYSAIRTEYVMGNYFDGNGWYIVYYDNFGEFEFKIEGMNIGTVAIGEIPHDTLLHTIKIAYTKSDSTFRSYVDGSLTHTYTGRWFTGTPPANTISGLCVGGVREYNVQGLYGSSYLNAIPIYTFKGKIGYIEIGKNGTQTFRWDFNCGDNQNIIERGQYDQDDRGGRSVYGDRILINGVGMAPDSLDVIFQTTGLKPGFVDPFTTYGNGIASAIYSEDLLSQDAFACQGTINTSNELIIVFEGNIGNGTSIDPNVGYDVLNCAAKWSGTEWVAMDEGLTGGTVIWVSNYGPGVVATGYHTTIVNHSTATNYISYWNGSSWEPMGDGLGDVGFCGTERGSDYFAGGFFVTVNGLVTSAPHIAKWDGVTWNDCNGGVDGVVAGIQNYGSKLLVYGYFTEANVGPISANGIILYDPDINTYSQLVPVACNTGGQVLDVLQCSDGWLYIVGNFSSFAGIPCSGICRYKDGKVQAVGTGISGHFSQNITSIKELNGVITVCGSFTRFNGFLSKNIAAFTLAGEMKDLGTGLALRGEGLTPHGSDMGVFGDFMNINGVERRLTARFTP